MRRGSRRLVAGASRRSEHGPPGLTLLGANLRLYRRRLDDLSVFVLYHHQLLGDVRKPVGQDTGCSYVCFASRKWRENFIEGSAMLWRSVNRAIHKLSGLQLTSVDRPACSVVGKFV